DYISRAREIKEDGTARSLGAYLTGKNQNDIQQPLYLFLLAPFMDNSPRAFTLGKLFSLFQTAALLALLMAMIWRLAGTAPAIIGAFRFVFAGATKHLSQMVLTDILYAGLFAGCCLWTARINDAPLQWLGLGMLTGLTFLSKGNGYMPFLVASVSGFITMR